MDVQEFHEEARKSINKNIYLLSITDGSYYLMKEKSIKDQELTKIEYLNTQFKGVRNLATTTNNLIKDLIPLISEWLQDNFQENEIYEEIEKFKILEATTQVKKG